PRIPDEKVRAEADNFLKECRYILQISDQPCSDEFKDADNKLQKLTNAYHQLKRALLDAGAQNTMDISLMVQFLDYYSQVHQTLDRTLKAAVYWLELRTREEACKTQ
ncbi:MAG TPA: hypothetical protein VJ879_09265, partial [Desulfobacter sp.]|nr:hypothetical protein [Desulfobacter sp.]